MNDPSKRSTRPQGCGVVGHDLECVGCGGRLYGRLLADVCPYLRTRSEVRAAQGTTPGCCARNANNLGCDCLRFAVEG